MKKILNLLKEKLAIVHNTRKNNSEKYKATNIILVLAFPIFISTLVEIIQMKTPEKYVEFLFSKPSVVLFSILLISFFFYALLMLVKKASIAAAVVGITMTTLSIVELFKFNTSGNHLILTDMKVATGTKSLGNLTKFAYIKITPELVVCVLILFIYLGAVFWFNPILKFKLKKRLITSFACFTTIFAMFFSPTIAAPVYSFFDVDTTSTGNVFKTNEKFENNNFVAFLAQTTTEFISRKVKEPEDYSVQTVSNMLENVPKDNSSFKKPNVIMIQSEAFTDFRIFDQLDIGNDVYKSYDNIRNSNKAFSGKAVVPAFGSFTVKTEFELMFGLPDKSLNDPNMPQRLLKDRPQQTIPSFYKSQGYNTSFIHTFARTFYSRGDVYQNYGYDNMYFDDNLTVPIEHFRAYISDTTIFNQMNKILKDNDDPSFIYTVTMQNHQPYDPSEQYPYASQLDYYLAGIKDMTQNLEKFLNSLEEPTVVLFIGDHFPCFKGEDSVYNQLNINGENSNNLYVQPYFIWNNFGMDYYEAPNQTISAFYLPYIVLDLIDSPKNKITQTMLDKMKTVPIYSTNYDSTTPNDKELDMFTYDLVLGEQYLKEAGNDTNNNGNNQ